MIDNTTCDRHERRGFLHKRIGRFAKSAFGTALSLVGAVGIPGISAGARVGRSLLRGGSRNPAFVGARAAQTARFKSGCRSGFVRNAAGQCRPVLPQSAPMKTNIVVQQAIQALTPGAGQCPKGQHLNKSTYFLKDGTRIDESTRCVKNRRRNNDNGRAAMRAARRLLGRKKSQDTIDKALRAFAPKASRRRSRAVFTGAHGHT